MHSSLLELSVGQFGKISAAAMAGLTHGAVALPVITGQRSEATPYPTIHKGSHTIHNTCTLYPTPHDTMQQNPGIGATSSGQAGHVGPFQVMVPHSDHQPPLGYWLYNAVGQPCFHELASSNSLRFFAEAGMQVHLGEGSVGLLQPP